MSRSCSGRPLGQGLATAAGSLGSGRTRARTRSTVFAGVCRVPLCVAATAAAAPPTATTADVDWLEREFAKAGCAILPRTTHPVDLWQVRDYGLRLLEGPQAGPVHVSSYFPRSGETPAGGVEGELVYCGAVPTLQLSANDE